MRQQLAALPAASGGEPDSPRHNEILAFLENEFGQAALRGGDYAEAARRFEAAIERDAAQRAGAPEPRGRPLPGGRVRPTRSPSGSACVDASPERAYLAFPRLENAYAQDSARRIAIPALCHKLIAANPQDWRARLALARHLAAGAAAGRAGAACSKRSSHHPHALALHQAIWQTLSALQLPPALVGRYEELTRDAIFYLDPHVCLRCRYRSTELLWQCPHCHEMEYVRGGAHRAGQGNCESLDATAHGLTSPCTKATKTRSMKQNQLWSSVILGLCRSETSPDACRRSLDAR